MVVDEADPESLFEVYSDTFLKSALYKESLMATYILLQDLVGC